MFDQAEGEGKGGVPWAVENVHRSRSCLNAFPLGLFSRDARSRSASCATASGSRLSELSEDIIALRFRRVDLREGRKPKMMRFSKQNKRNWNSNELSFTYV